MVNPGHRSYGCGECRKSKVKCDEARPACGRCVRTGRTCPGYQREGPAFRSMNRLAAAKVQRRVRERMESREPSRSSSAPPLPDEEPSPSPSAPAVELLMISPSPDWISQSVALFFEDMVDGPDFLDSTWGSYEFLPVLYRKGRAKHLTEAVHAASLANLASTSSVSELSQLAQQSYCRALQELGAAMDDPVSHTSDESLAAMTALAAYEIIVGERPLAELFHAHARGQSSILQIQKHQPAKGSTLFGLTNRTLMWRDLALRRRPTMCVTEWPTSTYSSSLGEVSARLTVQVVEICGRAREVINASDGRDTSCYNTYACVCADATKLHHSIRTYIENADEDWRAWSLPQRFASPFPLDRSSPMHSLSNLMSTVPDCSAILTPPRKGGVVKTPLQPYRIDVYPTRPVALLWNSLRCAWLHLLRAMIDLALLSIDNYLEYPDLPPVETIYGMISTVIEDVCAAVPYYIGDINEAGALSSTPIPKCNYFGLLWMMHKLCSIPGLDASLRQWIVTIFERIDAQGLRQGGALARLHRA